MLAKVRRQSHFCRVYPASEMTDTREEQTLYSRLRTSTPARYGVSLLSFAGAVWLTGLLAPALHQTSLQFFFAAVILSGWFGGFGPGILTTLMTVLAVRLPFGPPLPFFELLATTTAPALLLFTVICLLTSIGSESLLRAQRDARLQARMLAEQNARMQEQAIELEQQMEESQSLQEELEAANEGIQARNDDLERLHDAQAFLLEASTVLASSLDYVTTLRSVANLSVQSLADWCAVAIGDSSGRYENVALAHRNPERVRWAEEFNRVNPPDFDARTGVPEVLRTGKTEFYPEITHEMLKASARSEEHLRIISELGMRSAIVVPMEARGKVLGAITFVSAESGRVFDSHDVTLARDLATSAALAIDNARLLDSEHRANERLEAAVKRSSLLADASAILAGSLDVDSALTRLTAALTARMGEYAQVYLIDGPLLKRASLDCTDEQSRWALEELEKRPALRVDGHSPPCVVARSGQPMLVEHVDDAALERAAEDPNHAKALKSIGIRSMVITPLASRGRTIGVLLIARLRENAAFNQADLDLATEIGRRAGAAVDLAMLYAEALHARKEAEEANKAKKDFLAAMSHELRTPLNAIAGYTELLEMEIHGKISEPQREALTRIQRSQRHLLGLVEDVLSFAKVDAGRMEYQIEAVQLHDLLSRAGDMVAPQVAAKQLDYRYRPVDADLLVRADRDRLEQIILNLLANAVKFTDTG
jgi:K+-sensing histidine kinase KdpD